jgi:hypothetical protein
MRQLFAGASALSLVFLIALSLSQAQTAPVAPRAAGPSYYDPAQEVVLNGTVSSVLTKPSAEMLAGSHLLLSTLSGSVDISLGLFGLQGKGALSVAAGQQVEVTGVMKTFKGKQVLLARSVKVEGRLFAIRNEHGIPVTPQARERANQSAHNQETR